MRPRLEVLEDRLTPSADVLVFTSATQTLIAGQTSLVTVQLQDGNGNAVVAPTAGTLVHLSTDSSTGTFLDASGVPLGHRPDISILAGTSTTHFEYEDTTAGTPTLTALLTGLSSPTQQETVIPPAGSIHVTNTGDDPYEGAEADSGTLRAAIRAANDTPGSTIVFDPGVAGNLHINYGNLPLLTASTIIQGPGISALNIQGPIGQPLSPFSGPATPPTALGNGLFSVAAGATVTVSNLSFSEGDGTSPSYLVANQGNLTLQRVSVNTSTGGSNAIDNNGGTLDLDASAVQGGPLDNENNGSTLVLNSTIQKSANDGIDNNSGDVMLQNAVVADNAHNGIVNVGTLTVLASTIDGNNEGISVSGGSTTITNSTISGNSLTGIDAFYSPGPVFVTNSTLQNGIYGIVGPDNTPGVVLLANSIVAGDPQEDISYHVQSLGHNLIGNGYSSSGLASSDIAGTYGNSLDPKLGPLQNNGGPTPTMALLAGSEAIGAGSSVNSPAVDQRGDPRPTSGPIDIGAYEVQAAPITLGSTPLPPGTANAAYNQTIIASGGGDNTTISYTLAANNSIPAGLTFTPSGNTLVISGTPTASGSVTFTVNAGDSAGDTASQTYTLTVNGSVAKASPTISAMAGGSVAFGSGNKLTASATLSGGANPTGTITFTLHGPDGSVVDTEKAAVNDNGTYSTPQGYLPTGAGTYNWAVRYSGDSNNNAAVPRLDTTPTVTLDGQNIPSALAFDSSGNLFVANRGDGTVSEFAPGSTTPTATLTGLNYPDALAFDPSGNLFVANYGDGTVSEFAPGSTTPTATLTGLDPVPGYPSVALAFDSSGNLFVASINHNMLGNTVREFAPGSTTPTATLTGLNYPDALAFDPSGNLFVANSYGNTVSEFTPGSTTLTASLTGLNFPVALVFDPSGNLFVANQGNGTVSEFTPGSTIPTPILTGLDTDYGASDALASDPSGNLFVANQGNGTVSEFTPATSPEVVTQATPTLSVSDAGGTYDGSAFPATATISGGSSLEGVSPTLTYYAGTYSDPSQLSSLTPLSGAPSAVGNYTVLASFAGSTNYGAASALATFSIAPAITLSPATLPADTVAVAYNQTIASSGGTGAKTVSITSGSLPPGLTSTPGINQLTISGKPTASGNFSFTITATDQDGATATQNYTLRINQYAITLGPATLPADTVGTAYNQIITAGGGKGLLTIAYQLAPGSAIPQGMKFTASGNKLTISGTPLGSDAGTVTFSVTAQNKVGDIVTQNYTLTVNPAAPITLSPSGGSLPAGAVGKSYSQSITASGGSGVLIVAYQFASGSSLPQKMKFTASGNKLTISGTPLASGAGTVTFSVIARDQFGDTTTQSYTLTINPAEPITFSPSTLPAGTTGVSYKQLITASGGIGNKTVTYKVTSGALPKGLSITTGANAFPKGLSIKMGTPNELTISGTPTAAGTVTFTVTAKDNYGDPVGTQSYTLTVSAAGGVSGGTPSMAAPLSTASPSVTKAFSTTDALFTRLGSRLAPSGKINPVMLDALLSANGLIGEDEG